MFTCRLCSYLAENAYGSTACYGDSITFIMYEVYNIVFITIFRLTILLYQCILTYYVGVGGKVRFTSQNFAVQIHSEECYNSRACSVWWIHYEVCYGLNREVKVAISSICRTWTLKVRDFTDLVLFKFYYFYFKVKEEQKQKAEENFSEWKELKNKQRQQWKEQERQKKLENKAGEDFRWLTIMMQKRCYPYSS